MTPSTARFSFAPSVNDSDLQWMSFSKFQYPWSGVRKLTMDPSGCVHSYSQGVTMRHRGIIDALTIGEHDSRPCPPASFSERQ